MERCCSDLGVYAFGFLFMLPQLFVNYKVCSVQNTSCIQNNEIMFDLITNAFVLTAEISRSSALESLHVQGERCHKAL